jgi:hypothetical protein
MELKGLTINLSQYIALDIKNQSMFNFDKNIFYEGETGAEIT